uniref:rRNA-processing protein FYV7 n=1 Tax=Anopheles maculatus TaxID=74869 RepID=A0A182SH42_9DIPT
MNGNNKNNREKGRPHNGKQKQLQHQQHGNKRSPAAPSEIRFDSKPEKVNYCLAPERLEAQSRAMKQFEQKERQEEIERKKQDRQQKHKMMTQKTRKGQPVMQGRLELLYERVKKVVGVQ